MQFSFVLSLDGLDGKLNSAGSASSVCNPNFYSNQLAFANVIENLIIIYCVVSAGYFQQIFFK